MRAALEAGTDPLTIEVAGPDLEGQKAAIADAETKAVAGERERYKGITALASPGFESEIEAALESGASVEATALGLIQAAKDRGISLTSIKKDSTSAAAAAGGGGGGEKQSLSAKDIWNGRKGKK
ncbi:hypothetical protein [Pseudomonas asplenii]|uniref:hypothetical protein n=1 Tax=Pseudomonas asplenii TaxID=53407 RepID=UPI0002E9D8BB|nr:hypothetical protein [Pseudomonas fuscovaginae]